MNLDESPVDFFDRCWVESVILIARRDNPNKHGGTLGFSHAEARRAYRKYMARKAQYGEVPREEDPGWLSSYEGQKTKPSLQSTR